MKLGFDIDGIVANMAQVMIDKANEKFGLDYTVEIFERHSPFKVDFGKGPMNEEIAKYMLESVVHDKEAILNEVQPYPEALDALRKLRKAGHTLHFITKRRKDEYGHTMQWFRKHKVPFDTIDNVGPQGKGMLGRSMNLDMFVDDVYKNLEDMYKFKKRWRKGLILFTRPWNKWTFIDSNVYLRMKDWEEIFRHVGIHNR